MAMKEETRKARLAEGLCVQCGKEPLITKVLGGNCHARMLAYSARVITERKASNRCQRCNWPGVKPGRTHCDTCLLKQGEQALKRHHAIRQEVVTLRSEVEQLRAQLAQKGERNDSASFD